MNGSPNGWNFGWPVAVAIFAVVGGILALASMDKLPTELFGVIRWPTSSPSPYQPSTLSPSPTSSPVKEPSINPPSIPLTPTETIPSPTPSLTDEKTGVVADADGSANLRAFPSTVSDSNILTTVPNGTSVTILEELKDDSGQIWYKIQVGRQIGWMAKGRIKVN